MSYQHVALIGPPNVGKTTLFNRLTGLRQKVANYSGVTVEHRRGTIKQTGTEITDLPGVWSLSPTSEDQRISVRYLRGEIPGQTKPDAVLMIVDGSQLHRQLDLVNEVLAQNLPSMLLVNMGDVLDKRKGFLNLEGLSQSLGIPAALISAHEGTGFQPIYEFLAPPKPLSSALLPILQPATPAVGNCCGMNCAQLEQHGIYRRPLPSHWSRRIDSVALHPFFGPAMCITVLLLAFQCIFKIAQPLANALQTYLVALGANIGTHLGDGFARSFLIDGLWSGAASIAVFLPQILFLFLIISLLEDTGYMARAAVIADRTMGRVGLTGRSFLPMLSAYACAVPAIMATRTIGSRRDRITTIFIAPFMTCSARLPVYALLIAAFIPAQAHILGIVSMQAGVLMALYAVGVIAALFTSLLFGAVKKRTVAENFAMELPEYRFPSLRSVAISLVDRSRIFLKQVATIIITLNLAIWALAHFPLHNGQLSSIDSSYLGRFGGIIEPLLRPLGLNRHVGIALMTAFVARESVVSTLGTLYGTADVGHALRLEIGLSGAIGLMVFFALAMQCTSTLAVVKRETNSIKWPLLQLGYMSVLAYTAGVVAFQIAKHVLHLG